MKYHAKITRVLLPILAALSAGMTGCSRVAPGTVAGMGSSAQAAATPEGAAGHRVIVWAIDKTGSYHFTDQALEKAARELELYAQPGDIWHFRWIDNRSYSDRAAILTVRCPDLPAPPANPFHRVAREQWQAQRAHFDAVIVEAAELLRSDKNAELVKGTCVWGALAKACDIFGVATTGPRILVLSTDLGDTENRRVPLSLDRVRVTVSHFQGGCDPAAARALSEFWAETMLEAGAASIHVLDPTQSQVESLVGPD